MNMKKIIPLVIVALCALALLINIASAAEESDKPIADYKFPAMAIAAWFNELNGKGIVPPPKPLCSNIGNAYTIACTTIIPILTYNLVSALLEIKYVNK